MKSLHIKLNKNSPPIKWADAQADRIGARGHVGTHLDCYTTVPENLNTISQQWFLIVRMECPNWIMLKVLLLLKIWLYYYIQLIWRKTNTERICISLQTLFYVKKSFILF